MAALQDQNADGAVCRAVVARPGRGAGRGHGGARGPDADPGDAHAGHDPRRHAAAVLAPRRGGPGAASRVVPAPQAGGGTTRRPRPSCSSTPMPCEPRWLTARARVKELGGLASGFVGNVGLWVNLVRVPPSGTWERRRADRLALAEAWVGPEDATEAEGRAHLVRSYLTAFGPAPWKDIASWAGTGVTPTSSARRPRPRARHVRGRGGQAARWTCPAPRCPIPTCRRPSGSCPTGTR